MEYDDDDPFTPLLLLVFLPIKSTLTDKSTMVINDLLTSPLVFWHEEQI
jgi:hypothetical protein